MARLSIFLFGSFRVLMDGLPLTAFKTDKARALLAYLASEYNQSHRRETIAAMFWPDKPELAARNNLRQTLHRLNQAINASSVNPALLLVSTSEIQFNPSSAFWMDSDEFEACIIACHSHHPRGLSLCKECLARLESAVVLNTGDFLKGLTLADCPQFEWWRLSRQETYHLQTLDALDRLIGHYEQLGNFERVGHYCQQALQLEPWRESTHRQRMRALVLGGKQQAALHQYDQCRQLLYEEFGVEPSQETTRLYEQIRNQELKEIKTERQGIVTGPVDYPAVSPTKAASPFFGFEAELARLNHNLDDMLQGYGQVAFITGEAGSGKSTLINEFAQRAVQKHADLLVIGGRCRAHFGKGEPYLPFREALKMLFVKDPSSQIGWPFSESLTARLLPAQKVVRHTLENAGLDLESTLFQILVSRDLLAEDPLRDKMSILSPEDMGWIANPRETTGVQHSFFDQLMQVLQAVSKGYPLLLALDDLQWADIGSATLLFHLCRNLTAQRILIIGAYRSEEINISQKGERHPLKSVLNELQAQFGEIQINLNQADGHGFVEAMLASEPHHFEKGFCERFYQHTNGHPLFSVELLRGMQERGSLVKDRDGHWVASQELDWGWLPARVEGVIAERLGHLSPKCRHLLNVASIQGEVFLTQVLAALLEDSESEIIQCLSETLSKQHHLVHAYGLLRSGENNYASYRFRHALYQRYLYQDLDNVEQARLHAATGLVLESLLSTHDGEPIRPEISTARLAWHFEQARMIDKAAQYLHLAGKQAYLLSANDEAITHFRQAIRLLHQLPESVKRMKMEMNLQIALGAPLRAAYGYAGSEIEAAYSRVFELAQQTGDDTYLSIAAFFLSSLHLTRGEYQKAFALASPFIQLPKEKMESWQFSLGNMVLGSSHFLRGEFQSAREYLEELLKSDETPITNFIISPMMQQNSIFGLIFLSLTLWFLDYVDESLQYSRDAIKQTANLDHAYSKAFSQGFAGCLYHLFRREYQETGETAQHLLRLSQSKETDPYQGLVLFCLGRSQIELGEVDAGLQSMIEGLDKFQSTGQRFLQTCMLATLGEAYGLAGKFNQALKKFEQVKEVIEETGEHFFEAEVYRLEGELLLLQAEKRFLGVNEANVEAEHCFQKALQTARQQASKSLELRAATSLARLWVILGSPRKAHQLLEEIYVWFSKGLDTPDLIAARTLLEQISTAHPMRTE